MSTPSPALAQRRSVFWRIHAWAAIIASPFIVVAACTGLLYVFTPQVEQVLYAGLDRVKPSVPRRPLDEIVQAAMQAARGPEAARCWCPLNPTNRCRSCSGSKDTPTRGGLAAGHAGHGGDDAAAPPPPVRPAAATQRG
jgi:hypothetical protein